MGAGAPSWWDLLHELSTSAEDPVRSEAQKKLESKTPDYLAIADLLDAAIPDLRDRVVEILRRSTADRRSLLHSQLAASGIDAALTTNYDRLYEAACRDIKDGVQVIPSDEPLDGRARWLFKMHGDIEESGTITLTGQDYEKFQRGEGHYPVLRAPLQTIMMRRKLLLVGFSMSDGNFDQATAMVRKLVPGRESLGIVVAHRQPDTWVTHAQDFELLDLSGGIPEEREVRVRRIGLFVDEVLSHLSHHAHVLDARFEGAATHEEIDLRERLVDILDHRPEAPTSGAWRAVDDLLKQLGHRPTVGAVAVDSGGRVLLHRVDRHGIEWSFPIRELPSGASRVATSTDLLHSLQPGLSTTAPFDLGEVDLGPTGTVRYFKHIIEETESSETSARRTSTQTTWASPSQAEKLIRRTRHNEDAVARDLEVLRRVTAGE